MRVKKVLSSVGRWLFHYERWWPDWILAPVGTVVMYQATLKGEWWVGILVMAPVCVAREVLFHVLVRRPRQRRERLATVPPGS